MATAPAQMPLLDDEAKKAAAVAAAAAAPAPAGAEYKPITQPPEGLLQTAVGTPTQPLAPIDPATYENDDVVNQMNNITSQDSDYMKLARTSGLQTANKRGLLNSSIAAGASQASALAAAAPLAQQNSQNMASRNLARIQGYFKEKEQTAQFGHETEMQAADIENKLKMQGIDITADEATQLREFATRLNMQGIDIAAQEALQTRQLQSARELADLNIAAESERLGRQLTAQETQQIRQIASNESMAKMEAELKESQFARELTSREGMQRLQEEGLTARANQDAATRVQLQTMETATEEQKAMVAAYIETNKMYADSIDKLWANQDMPAPARQQAMDQILQLRNATLNMPAATFGRPMVWAGGTGGGGTGGTGDGVTAPVIPQYNGPGPEEIAAMRTNGQPGDAQAAATAYNAWATANGQPLIPVQATENKPKGGLLGMGGALNIMSPAALAVKTFG